MTRDDVSLDVHGVTGCFRNKPVCACMYCSGDTAKLSAGLSMTVSLAPSMATGPFTATQRRSSGGVRKRAMMASPAGVNDATGARPYGTTAFATA